MEHGVSVEDLPSGVRVVTLCNEAKRNALDGVLLEGLAAAFAPSSTAHVRAFLVRGAGGKAFCAGYDLDTLVQPGAEGGLPDDRLMEVLAGVEAHRAPSVALVDGGAVGAGCDLAAACDFRVGTERAVFCMPPARLGIVYAPQGLQRLSRLCGSARAKRMFFTACRVDAKTALGWGLLDELQTDAEVAALKLCEELAQGAPLALSGMKREFELLGRTALTPEEAEEARALRRAAFNSADAAEGRAAFIEKRVPRFGGH